MTRPPGGKIGEHESRSATEQAEETGNPTALVSGERQYPFTGKTEDGRVILWHPAGGCSVLPKGEQLSDELRIALHQQAEFNTQFYPSDYDMHQVRNPRVVDGGQTIRHREHGQPVRVDLLSVSPDELAELCGIPDYQREWVLDACRTYLASRLQWWDIHDIPGPVPLLKGWTWMHNPSGGCSVLPPDTDLTDELRMELLREAETFNLRYPPGCETRTSVDCFDMAKAQKIRHRVSGEWITVDLFSVSPDELVELCGVPESHRDIVIEACRKHLETAVKKRKSGASLEHVPLFQD